MHELTLQLLGGVSAELVAMVRSVACAVAALRLGSGHVSGFIWQPGLLVTSARVGRKTAVVLPGGRTVQAERLAATEHVGVAAFRLPVDDPARMPPQAENAASVGALVLVLGAAADASPTARLAMVDRADAHGLRLAGLLDATAEGGAVLDATGRLLGMALPAPDRAFLVVECATIARALSVTRPGWIGVAFRPTLVPATLRAEAGQDSGRLVVRLTEGGPADEAGLLVGDIVLALDGVGLSGTGTLRGFLAAAEPGDQVVARVVRGGRISTVTLIVGAEPKFAAPNPIASNPNATG